MRGTTAYQATALRAGALSNAQQHFDLPTEPQVVCTDLCRPKTHACRSSIAFQMPWCSVNAPKGCTRAGLRAGSEAATVRWRRAAAVEKPQDSAPASPVRAGKRHDAAAQVDAARAHIERGALTAETIHSDHTNPNGCVAARCWQRAGLRSVDRHKQVRAPGRERQRHVKRTTSAAMRKDTILSPLKWKARCMERTRKSSTKMKQYLHWFGAA